MALEGENAGDDDGNIWPQVDDKVVWPQVDEKVKPKCFSSAEDLYQVLVTENNTETHLNRNLLDELSSHVNRFPSSFTYCSRFIDYRRVKDVFLHMNLLAAAKGFLNGIAISITSPVDVSKVEVNLSAEGSHDVRAFDMLFATLYSPPLLGQLSKRLHGIGYDISETHMVKTVDGYGLYVFCVTGKNKELKVQHQAVAKALTSSSKATPQVPAYSELFTGVKLVVEAQVAKAPVVCVGCGYLNCSSGCKGSARRTLLNPIYCRECGTFNYGAGCMCALIPRVLRLRRFTEKKQMP